MKSGRRLFCVLLVNLAYGLPQSDDSDYDNIIEELFTKPPVIAVQTFAPPVPTQATPATPSQQQEPSRIGTGSCRTGFDCVPYYQCKEDGTINKDGTGLIDIRFGEEDHPGNCSHYLQTCCSVSDTIEKPTETELLPELNVPKEGCGYRNKNGLSFKVAGGRDNETEYGEFPWMIAVLKELVLNGQPALEYLCGGSLIHPSVVLTAAHYMSGKVPDALKLVAGEWDAQTDLEFYPTQTRNVAQISVHPHFYKGGLYNDVALIFVTEPYELASHIRTICLPPPNFSFDRLRCFASGWGKDVYGAEGKYQAIMKKIEVPVVPRKECQVSLRQTKVGPHFILHDSFICAGGEGKDTCKGDGGGPLICPIAGQTNRYYQAGIVAWGIGCGIENVPGVYASVSKLRTWIDEELEYKNIDKSYLTP